MLVKLRVAVDLSYTHTHTRLTALCPGLPRWASTRKVKPVWILLKHETASGSGISWAIMQVCTSLQTDNHTSIPPLLCFLQAGCPSCHPTNSVKACLCLTVVAKLFHTCGPVIVKLLSPRVVRVRGTASALWRWGRPELRWCCKFAMCGTVYQLL